MRDRNPSSRQQPPPVEPQADWSPVEPLRIEGGRGSFVTGDPGADRLRVAYFRRSSDDHLVGRAWFGAGAVGPPGHAHGGSIAAVLDEAMGAAAWLAGFVVVAVNLNVDFRNMLPLGTDAVFDAWVESVDGRKVTCRGRLFGDGGDFAEATGLFVTLPEERFRDMLDQVARAMGTTPEELRAKMRARGWKG